MAWVVIAWFAHSNRYESFYPSLSEAAKDGAISRGWIPDDLLPSSSRAIHEAHDLSPSREWCAFEFAPTDSSKFLRNLNRADVPPASIRHVPNPNVAWWPPVLVGNLEADKIHKAGFEIFVAERQATSVTTEVWLFAINRTEGRGFFSVGNC
jgi:hypothetical protein